MDHSCGKYAVRLLFECEDSITFKDGHESAMLCGLVHLGICVRGLLGTVALHPLYGNVNSTNQYHDSGMSRDNKHKLLNRNTVMPSLKTQGVVMPSLKIQGVTHNGGSFELNLDINMA